jgi:hypothetical protein
MDKTETIQVQHVCITIKGLELKLTVGELCKLRLEIDSVIGPLPAAPVYIPVFQPVCPPAPNTNPFWYSDGPISISVNPNSEEWPNNWTLHRGPLHTSSTLGIHVN